MRKERVRSGEDGWRCAGPYVCLAVQGSGLFTEDKFMLGS